jgi:hypothetical protein
MATVHGCREGEGAPTHLCVLELGVTGGGVQPPGIAGTTHTGQPNPHLHSTAGRCSDMGYGTTGVRAELHPCGKEVMHPLSPVVSHTLIWLRIWMDTLPDDWEPTSSPLEDAGTTRHGENCTGAAPRYT